MDSANHEQVKGNLYCYNLSRKRTWKYCTVLSVITLYCVVSGVSIIIIGSNSMQILFLKVQKLESRVLCEIIKCFVNCKIGHGRTLRFIRGGNTCAYCRLRTDLDHPPFLRRHCLHHVNFVSNLSFTITTEIHARSLANFYSQYTDRHIHLQFLRRVSERERAIGQFVIVKKQIDVSS